MTSRPYRLSKFKGRVIAIDGPAGSGKSTTAKILAARLGYQYLDTGAMYRALTWFAIQNGVAPSDGARLSVLARSVEIKFETHEDVNRVFINGREVTDEIRSPMVTQLVSEVSAHKGVREAMVDKQREMGVRGEIVAEGRDTTTVVFADADVKVYLDCDVATRAQRRLIDMARLGVSTTLEEQIEEIQRRDKLDSERKHSPLTRSRDSYLVDTTNTTIEEQVERVLALLKTVLK
ncbi:MAG: (d)CMP kinase [Candidatus Zixiibacteriota bacterium]